jgi:hypothetical protein
MMVVGVFVMIVDVGERGMMSLAMTVIRGFTMG